ncbi:MULTISPECIES: right-handed parallel beta-helix repeat-containing protein [unclassified Meiothermus]|uniref:right-handed parallel beta-helix repeat-containing protein n=1 Tax=unclassified Meiothermus TaxID=370471 RepID=UPI000D7C5BF9|nr:MULTISPECIES: right-handed parallel beta-helix repeat-containing protein [unclassified Meiothermus]PZA07738.1 hypothetical protein DNA98_05365 [Meiothermus sp. Pnk-1]RYM37509.1 right-handed parallel beta-helix repeat-containing protein [Meiothermus sp. PNK-Is4]
MGHPFTRMLAAAGLLLLLTGCPSTPPPGFTLALNPASLTVTQGNSGTTQLTLTPQNGFAGTVNLALVDGSGNAVPGITVSPASLSVTGGSPVNQALTISVASGVAVNTYNLKLRATGGSQTREAGLTLTVQGAPGFTLALSPSSLSALRNESKTTQLTLTPQNGFTGTVSLSLVNPPAGVTLSPNSLTVSGPGSVQQPLTLATSAGTPAGSYTLTLKATSGGLERTVPLSLTVDPALLFTVNTPADTVDATPGDQACADSSQNCSLRAAVMEANHLSDPVVVQIPAGIYTLTLTGNDEGGGDLDLNGNITLRGAGQASTILDGNGTTGLIKVYSGKTVRIEGLTLRKAPNNAFGVFSDGNLTLDGVALKDNLDAGAYINGGTATLSNVTVSGNGKNGIFVNGGSLTLTDSTLSDNPGTGLRNYGTATLTNVTVSGNGGGGILNTGTLTLTNVTVSGNSTTGDGGGIANEYSGTLTLTNVTVSGNSTTVDGGGIANSGTLTLEGVTVSGNRARNGGGIYNTGTLTLKDTTVSGNSATNGGGIAGGGTLTNVTVSGNSATNGGGIYGGGTLTNVTVSGNSATGNGGGIYGGSTLKVAFSTLTNNTASSGGGLYFFAYYSGSVPLKGVILAGNTATSSGPDCSGGGSYTITSSGYNLVGNNADCNFSAQGTDLVGTGSSPKDPQLNPLADNGGPVQTHLPQSGSPVLDQVPPSACTDLDGNSVATDARGVSRPQPQNGKCDIGAVERD